MSRYSAIILSISIAVVVLGFPPERAEASISSTYPVEALCPSRLMLRYPDRCSPVGPSARILELARLGMYPEKPLPTIPIEESMSYLPFGYLRASNAGAAIFASEDAARSVGNASQRVNPGFVYLSYRYFDNPGEPGDTYRAQQGFVNAGSVARVTPSYFKGFAFGRNPERSFGWINTGGSCSMISPGDQGAGKNRCYMRHEVVQLYDERFVAGDVWYLIGPDEWLQDQFISRVDLELQRPEGVEGERWISVNLAEQTITAYDRGQMVYATVISSGRSGTWTQPGTFQVWAKLQRDNMTGGIDEGFYYLEDVPWVLYFDQARALHGTYWHNQFGTTNSRGCVNLSVTDARWFFEFAEEGSWVHVWDPSGETPTDPGLYGAGGA